MVEARLVSEGAVEWIVDLPFSLANAAGFHARSLTRRVGIKTKIARGPDASGGGLRSDTAVFIGHHWQTLLASATRFVQRLSRIPFSLSL
jgi:hypothetical protein